MGIRKKKEPKVEEPKEVLIRYDVTMQCPVCKELNNVVYIPNQEETFTCHKCKQKSVIVMSFIAMKENPPGVQTMMVDNSQFERRINRNIGGVITNEHKKEVADSGAV